MIWTLVITALAIIGIIWVYTRMVQSGKIKAIGATDCCLWDANDNCIAKIGDPRCAPGGSGGTGGQALPDAIQGQ